MKNKKKFLKRGKKKIMNLFKILKIFFTINFKI
jgi:hypothetical protein